MRVSITCKLKTPNSYFLPIYPLCRSQHDFLKWLYDKLLKLSLGHSFFVSPTWWQSLEPWKLCYPEAFTPSTSQDKIPWWFNPVRTVVYLDLRLCHMKKNLKHSEVFLDTISIKRDRRAALWQPQWPKSEVNDLTGAVKFDLVSLWSTVMMRAMNTGICLQSIIHPSLHSFREYSLNFSYVSDDMPGLGSVLKNRTKFLFSKELFPQKKQMLKM